MSGINVFIVCVRSLRKGSMKVYMCCVCIYMFVVVYPFIEEGKHEWYTCGGCDVCVN